MIGIAVIGAGRWGPNLIHNFETDRRSRVVSVADRDPARLRVVNETFPQIQTTEDSLEAIENPDVEAVVIATPASTHFALANAALRTGKHVLVEKPIATNLADAGTLCELASRTDCVLLVGHVFVFNAAVRCVKGLLKKQHLGRVYYMSMQRTNLGPIRTDVNAAWDLAAHDISIANYWLDAQPESVSAVGTGWINNGLEDVVFATLQYPENVLVNFHASWLHPKKNRDITVVGERRMLIFDDMNMELPVRVYDKQVRGAATLENFGGTLAAFRTMVHEGEVSIPPVGFSEPLRNECEHFLECIQSGTQPVTDAAFGLAVVRALDAVARSVRQSGRPVEILP